MTAVAFVSAKGAPGVTTSALLLTALLPGSVLIEADPSGGDLRCWLTDVTGQPLRPDVGVVSLLAAHRTTLATAAAGNDGTLLAHAQQLPGGLPLLVGPGAPAQADALAPSWPLLTRAVTAHSGLVLLDLGRLTPGSPASWEVLGACSLTLVVTTPSTAAVAHTRDLLALLHTRGQHTGVLVIGEESQRVQVADALHGARWSGRLPHDPPAAQQLTSGVWTRRLNRSPLLAAGRHLAAQLHDTLTTHTALALAPPAALSSSAARPTTNPYPAEPTAAGVGS